MTLRLAVGLGALAAASVWAQSVVAARAGLIHYVEGTVMLDGQRLQPRPTEFPEAAINQLLNVGDGRAEVLLNPGSVLRLGRNSAMRLLSNGLDDTRIALLAGTAMIEIDELLDGNRVAVRVNRGNQVQLLKRGLYHFNADTAEFRVYDGKAQVTNDGQIATVTKGRTIHFDATLAVTKFDTKAKDDVFLWSQNRARAMAQANMSVANSLDRKTRLAGNSWYYDSWYRMFTFLPARGTIRSPYGWSWYSPSTIWIVFAPQPTYSAFDAGSPRNASWQGMSTNSGAAASSVAPDAGVAVRSAPAESAPAAPSGGRSR